MSALNVRGADIWDIKGIPYVIPDIEDATDELLELVIRRHLVASVEYMQDVQASHTGTDRG